MTSLIKYEAALLALAEARSVDEVKPWVDKAAAMQAYGRMAKDKTLEVDASEIRLRAERRLGELLTAQKETVGLNEGPKLAGAEPGNNDGWSAVVTNDRRPTLADAGISKDLSSRAQKLAAVPAADFERELGEHRERVSAEGVRVTARLASAGAKALGKPAKTEKLENEVADLKRRLAEANELVEDLRTEMSDLLAIQDGDEAKRLAAHRADLKAVSVVRDQYMRENAQLKKQCTQYRRRLGEDKRAA